MNAKTPDSDIPEILKLSDLSADETIHFEFEQDMLSNEDTGHFLDSFKPHPTASKSDVRNLLGRVTFSFEPLELEGELWEHPEVRAYISKLNALWPCWLYYCVPDHQVLLPILACLCSDIRTVHHSVTGITTIAVPPDETLPVFLQWMVNALKLADWAGVPKKVIAQRLHAWMGMLLPAEIAKDYEQTVLKCK